MTFGRTEAKLIALTYMITLSILMVTDLRGAIINWDAGDDGASWTDPLNWDCDCLPTSDDELHLNGDYSAVTAVGTTLP